MRCAANEAAVKSARAAQLKRRGRIENAMSINMRKPFRARKWEEDKRRELRAKLVKRPESTPRTRRGPRGGSK